MLAIDLHALTTVLRLYRTLIFMQCLHAKETNTNVFNFLGSEAIYARISWHPF